MYEDNAKWFAKWIDPWVGAELVKSTRDFDFLYAKGHLPDLVI